MIQDYLIGELSVRLQQLETAATPPEAAKVARLRQQVEDGPTPALAAAVTRGLAMADSLCWQSLEQGDSAAFARQARASADLRQFSICAHLIPDA